MSREIKLIAHGGYSAKYPENTLQSYKAAVPFNPYGIEMDVVLDPIRDELVCYHPSGLSSTEGTYTQNELETQHQAFAQHPLLIDVMRVLKGTHKFLIDFKQPSKVTFEKLLTRSEISFDKLIIGVRNLEHARLVRSCQKYVDLLALFSIANTSAEEEKEQAANFIALGGSFFRLWEDDVTEERIARLHDQGLEVWVTPGRKATATEPRTAGVAGKNKMKRLSRLAIDALLVNDIEFATRYLYNRNKLG